MLFAGYLQVGNGHVLKRWRFARSWIALPESRHPGALMSSEGIDIVRMEEVLQKGPPLQAKGGVSVWTVQ